MPNFTKEQLHALMGNTKNIRNMSVVAHVDTGKSTMSDALLQKAGIISKASAGLERETDTTEEEKARGITIKSTGVSMAFEYKKEWFEIDESSEDTSEESNTCIINLIDTPGHIDFNSNVTSALRLTDGSIVLVDCIEGVMVQTETVLRQSLQEKVRPVLMMNKLDRVIIEQKMPLLDAYHKMRKCVENINIILAQYDDPDLGDLQFDPRNENVAFGSAYNQWAFTLGDFATLHATRMTPKTGDDGSELSPSEYKKKFIEIRSTLLKYMWGDYYYDKKTGKFTKVQPTPETEPVFCEFVLKYLYEVINAAMDNNAEVIEKVVKRYSIKLEKEEKEERDRKMAKALMRNWLPMSNCLLKMIFKKLPSPIEAQKYRSKYLYTGPMDDEAGVAMTNCDPNGPVMMYISKMVPEKEGSGRFYAFGRVFSGTIKAGESYKVMGPNYEFGSSKDVSFVSAQRVVTMMAAKFDTMTDIPCGNTCALLGIDKNIVKTGTVSSFKDAYLIRDMKFAVAPVVQVSVSPKNGADLPKLLDALGKLAKSDPMCIVMRDEETKENVVAGSGELHMEILINDLQKFMGGEVIVKNPIVAYRETVLAKTEKEVLAKSKNCHNRAWITAEPIDSKLCSDIEDGKIVPKPKDEVAQTRYLVSTYGLDPEECGKRMWGFWPTDNDPNMLVNSTVGIAYLDTVRDSMKSGTMEATLKGPLMGEKVRGAMFRVHDVKLHTDSVHRGIDQIAPMTKKACYGAFLNSQPRVMEPMYICSVTLPSDITGTMYSLLAKRRGQVFFDEVVEGTPMSLMKAYLPVRESFGFDAVIKENTSGKAFMQNSFSHYEIIDQDPYDPTTLANKIVMEVRNRKKIGEIPTIEHYVDRL